MSLIMFDTKQPYSWMGFIITLKKCLTTMQVHSHGLMISAPLVLKNIPCSVAAVSEEGCFIKVQKEETPSVLLGSCPGFPSRLLCLLLYDLGKIS